MHKYILKMATMLRRNTPDGAEESEYVLRMCDAFAAGYKSLLEKSASPDLASPFRHVISTFDPFILPTASSYMSHLQSLCVAAMLNEGEA